MKESYRDEVLSLLSQGKITAAEAATMLADVTREKEGGMVEREVNTAVSAPTPQHQPFWFRVHVGQLSTGKSKVRVSIPLAMLRFGLKIGRRFVPEIEGIDWDEIQSAITEFDNGLFIEVEDEESDEHVRIFVE